MKLNLKIGKPTLFDICALVVSGVSVVVAVASKNHLKKVSDKLAESVDELICDEVDTIHIAQSVVDEAIVNKCNKEVVRMMPEAINAGRREATRLFNDEVRREVSLQYSDIKKEVKAKVESEITKIDIDKIREDLLAAGKKYVTEKMEDDVDRVVDDFKSDLEDMLYELKDDTKEEMDDKINDIADRFEERRDTMIKIYSNVANRFSKGE